MSLILRIKRPVNAPALPRWVPRNFLHSFDRDVNVSQMTSDDAPNPLPIDFSETGACNDENPDVVRSLLNNAMVEDGFL